MTSNIWGDYFGNPVNEREDELYTVYSRYEPDVLGLQEATGAWHNSKLFEALKKDYTMVDIDVVACKWFDENGHKGAKNYVPLYFKTEKYELITSGWFHYTQTDDLSKCVTYAVLRDKATQGVFGVCATHYWWMTGEEHDLVRVNNSKELLAKMKELAKAYSCPVFAFGDLNCRISSEAFRYLMDNGCVNMQKAAKKTSEISSHHGDPVRGEDGKYHGSITENGADCSIDHIVLYGDAEISEYNVITDREALDATDHSPVYADVTI